MKESRIWKYFAEEWKTLGGARRIEVKGRKGFPDVLYVHRETGIAGFLELKNLPGWDLTYDQAIWLMNWVNDGGCGGILAYKVPEYQRYLRAAVSGAWIYWQAEGSLGWVRSMVRDPMTQKHERIPDLTSQWLEQRLIADFVNRRYGVTS